MQTLWCADRCRQWSMFSLVIPCLQDADVALRCVLQVLLQGLAVWAAALSWLLPVLGGGGGDAAGRSAGHGALARQLRSAQVRCIRSVAVI
jgi:hypothetical protein